jgi:hypothetical protein
MSRPCASPQATKPNARSARESGRIDGPDAALSGVLTEDPLRDLPLGSSFPVEPVVFGGSDVTRARPTV